MAFNVLRPSEPSLNFTDDERLEIVDGGVLKICRADGTNLYINPSTWLSIEKCRHRYGAGGRHWCPLIVMCRIPGSPGVGVTV